MPTTHLCPPASSVTADVIPRASESLAALAIPRTTATPTPEWRRHKLASQKMSQSKHSQRHRDPERTIKRVRTPQCGHIWVDRIRSSDACQICQSIPSIGWLYSCNGNHVELFKHKTDSTLKEYSALKGNASHFETEARTASSLGLSMSVVEQIKDGEYTVEQIRNIFEQRTRVIHQLTCSTSAQDIILEATETPRHYATNFDASQLSHYEIDPSGYVAYRGCSANEVKLPSSNRSKTTKLCSTSNKGQTSANAETCNLKVCYNCRPCLEERLHMSIDAVLNDEVRPITRKESNSLRVLDAKILSNIDFTPVNDYTHSLGREAGKSESMQCDNIEIDLRFELDKIRKSVSEEVLFGDINSDIFFPSACETRPIIESDPRGGSIPSSSEVGMESNAKIKGLTESTSREYLGNDNSPLLQTSSSFQSLALSFRPYYRGQDPAQAEQAELSPADEIIVEGGLALTEEAVVQGMPDIAETTVVDFAEDITHRQIENPTESVPCNDDFQKRSRRDRGMIGVAF